MKPVDGGGSRRKDIRVPTFTMKAMVLTIALCTIGLLIGFAGLAVQWHWAKIVGAASLVVLGLIFWLFDEIKTETLDRLLQGPNEKK